MTDDYVGKRLKELGLTDAEIYRARVIGEPVPARSRMKYPYGTTEKPCSRCKIVKPLNGFAISVYGALNRHNVCYECRAKQSREYHKAKQEAKAKRTRPDVCECCGQAPKRRAIHWDHDHVTGEFRGWLCHACNGALGQVDDSVERLQLLIAYLQRGGGPA